MENISKYYNELGECYAVKCLDKQYMEQCTLRKLQCHEFIVDKLKRYVKRKCPFYDLPEYHTLEDALTKLNTYNNQNDIDLHNKLATRERKLFLNNTEKNIKKSIADFDLYYKDILENKEKNSKNDRKEYLNKYVNNFIKTAKHQTCVCGSEVNIYKKTQHLNTLKHKKYIETI
jgi:hypothetical protein